MLRTSETTAHQGYLLFEDEDEAHSSDLVPASMFGDLLQSKRVGLVILSACQSAMVSGEDALGSVAPRLIRAGIPSVLAMTQSVLVATTRALSRYFYRDLAAGRPIGAALDFARTQLYANPERGEHQRPSGTVQLTLQDWFVPALYQAGTDGALLKQVAETSEALPEPRHNLLEAQESGFHGRARELRYLESWFVGGTRRIVISGFGGQGKTALAIEAGRWLLRSGLFERVCFVSYAGFQGADAVQLALSTLSTMLGADLIDAKAALEALRRTSTLLILDNLEALTPEARTDLLTEASSWSAQEGSRVLLTTRPDDLGHKDYSAEGSNRCRHLRLAGLAPLDALDWFQALLQLPPEPSVLIPPPEVARELFARVGFHPLSIGVLTGVLKQRRVADVAEALRTQLARNGDPLLASLTLSLGRLDPEAQAALPGLGVFIDGAWERVLIQVLDLDEARWGRLREGLRQAGLMVVEAIPGRDEPFLRFHPTLASAMRERLVPEQLAVLRQRYRSSYYWLSAALYDPDLYAPDLAFGEAARVLARLELSNLLAGVFDALEHGEDFAADFAERVRHYLKDAGRTRDLDALTEWAVERAGKIGSEAWFLAQADLGNRLSERGQFAAAEAIFANIICHFDNTPSYRRGAILRRMAVCLIGQGRLDRAQATLQEALSELATLQADRQLRDLEADTRCVLGDVHRTRGDLENAEAEYRSAMAISQELRDGSGMGASAGRLGMVYLQKSYLHPEFLELAIESFRIGLQAFERLNQPCDIAISYHQLGMAYAATGANADAEKVYREAARIFDSLGDRRHAATTWSALANVFRVQGRPVPEVEQWYRKALSGFNAENDRVAAATTLGALAHLLGGDPQRLSEARNLGEQAVAIRETLDPDAAEIWETYGILATIATQQGDVEASSRYQARERHSYAATPTARLHLRYHRGLIGIVLAALRQPSKQSEFEQVLAHFADRGMDDLVTALRALHDGSRDEDRLCEPLNREQALIVMTVLRCLADHAAEQALFANNT